MKTKNRAIRQDACLRQCAQVFVFLSITITLGCKPSDPAEAISRHQVRTALISTNRNSPSQEPVRPLPQSVKLDQSKVMLGKELFHDKRFSHNNTISCASCHQVSQGGDDGLATSVGIEGAQGSLNSPTVLNAVFNLAQFWDGRAKTLEEQAPGPIHNPIEMGSDWSEVVAKLNRDRDLVLRFAATYSDGLTVENIVDAIVTYERALITPNSPFDRYLRGEEEALTAREKQGYQLFKQTGCISCHQGMNIGGNLFQKLGVMLDYPKRESETSPHQSGRFGVTGREVDLEHFKVPTLRNVALTSPYLHDGSAKTLTDVVKIMGEYQLGRELTNQQVDLLVEFLRTLTGELREDLQ